MTQWSKVRQNNVDNYIFNTDKTGLFFFKHIPIKTLSFKNEKYSDEKLSEKRITVLV